MIGEQTRVQGFALVGAEVHPVSGPDAIRAAWAGLSEDVAVVILTPAAAAIVEVAGDGGRLTAVMPA